MDSVINEVNCIRNIGKLALTDVAVEFCESFGLPIVAKDFLGYLINVTKKESCLVGVDNTLIPVSSDIKRPKMTRRRIKKVFKELTNAGFLKYQKDDPFPEMERYNNIKIDISRAFKIDGCILEKRQEHFEFDDDIDFTDS